MQSQNLWRIDLSHFLFLHSSIILVFSTVTNVFGATIFFISTVYELSSAWELGWSMCLQGLPMTKCHVSDRNGIHVAVSYVTVKLALLDTSSPASCNAACVSCPRSVTPASPGARPVPHTPARFLPCGSPQLLTDLDSGLYATSAESHCWLHHCTS